MQGGNQVSDTVVASGGFAILGNNLSAAGNITINAGPSSEKKCLQALFATDPADDRAKHISFKGNPVRSIFTWITNVKAYKSWVDRGTGSRLLWISGGPGMGKTMLAIFLSEELKQIADDNGLVLYYFCEGRDPKRNCTINILRGLIYTLVQQRPRLMKHLLPDYEVRSDALFESDAIEPLWRILVNMVRDPTTGPVYCIIDGIDECASTSLTHLEHILKKLAGFYHLQITQKAGGDNHEACKAEATSPEHFSSQHDETQATPHTAPPVFKVALISREEPECLPRELSEFERVQLTKPEQTPTQSTEPPIDGKIEDFNLAVPVSVSQRAGSLPSSPPHAEPTESSGYACSLDLYISTKVDDLVRSKGFDEDYGDLMKEQLAARGDGTFLWVDTAVDQLSENASQYSGPDLSTLPSRTDGLYCLGLLEAPQSLASTIAFVLRWTTVAFRPLTISELSSVVYFVNGQPNGPELEEVRCSIGACRSLVDVSENGEVKLAHQSTKAFLTDLDSPLVQDPRTQQFHVNEDMTHAEIASVSIAYVERSPFHQNWWHLLPLDVGTTSEQTVVPSPDLLAHYPFIQYASLYWPSHLNWSPPGRVNLRSPLFSPGSDIRRHWFQSVWEVTRCRDGSLTPSYMSLLHIAAFFDLQELAQVLSRREPPNRFKFRIEKMNSELMTPLFTAADRGSLRVFAFLLDHGASQKWNASGEDILQFSSRRGRLELVKTLISRGANPNEFLSENIGIKTASLALRHAPKRLKNYLINAGNPEDQDINELIRVDYGANMSPLQCAVCCGHEEVAQVLLRCGANVHYTTTAGWTAMHFAAWAGQTNIIHLLQQYAGSISVLSNSRWSPLHCAAWRGRTGAGEYLIGQRIHPDLHSSDMQTPLHLAAFRGHDEMVMSLLTRGSNAEARTNKGLTPLHLAAAEGHDATVQVLLAYGANRHATSNRGQNAFTLALDNGHGTTAQLLQTYRSRPHVLESTHAVAPLASPCPAISCPGNSSSHATGSVPDHTTAHTIGNQTGVGGPSYHPPIHRKPLSSSSPAAFYRKPPSSTSPATPAISDIYDHVPDPAIEISEKQLGSQDRAPSRDLSTGPVVHPLQNLSKDQDIVSPNSATVVSPFQEQHIIESRPGRPYRRQNTTVAQSEPPGLQHEPTPPPLPPRPRRLSEELQQMPRWSYQQSIPSIQSICENNPHEQCLETRYRQQAVRWGPQYTVPHYDEQRQRELGYSSPEQRQYVNTNSGTSSSARTLTHSGQGPLPSFKI
jgi:ankyrin repeat protein